MPTIVVLLFVVHVLHTCQVYCPACTTSVLAYPRAAYNPFQVRRLVDLVLSHPIDAGLMVKLKPRLPLLREMRRLCSLAEVTYSEFGMTFDRNITARYAARVADLESLTRSRPPFCPLYPPITASSTTPHRRPSLLGTW